MKDVRECRRDRYVELIFAEGLWGLEREEGRESFREVIVLLVLERDGEGVWV